MKFTEKLKAKKAENNENPTENSVLMASYLFLNSFLQNSLSDSHYFLLFLLSVF